MNLKVIKFASVGILNNLFNFLTIFFSNKFLGLSNFVSGSLGFGVGALISYLLNSKYTFKYKKVGKKNLLKFMISQIIILFCFSYLFSVLSNFFNLIFVNWLITTLLIFMLNYFIQLKIIFKS